MGLGEVPARLRMGDGGAPGAVARCRSRRAGVLLRSLPGGWGRDHRPWPERLVRGGRAARRGAPFRRGVPRRPRLAPRRGGWTRRSPDTIAKGRTGVEGRRDLAVSVVPAPATIDDQAVGRLVLRVHRERRSSEGRARDGPLARPRRFGGRDLRRGSRAGAASRLHGVARGGHGADSPSSWSSAGPVQPTRHRNTVASAAHRGRRSSAHPARVPRHRSAGGGRIQPRRRLLPLLLHCDDDVHGLGGPS